MNNPIEVLKMIKNPEKYVRDVAKQQNNPMLNNLIKMAEGNKQQDVENFARNVLKEQGQDFDSIMDLFH